MTDVISFACTWYSMKQDQTLGTVIKSSHQLFMKFFKAWTIIHIKVFDFKAAIYIMRNHCEAIGIGLYHVDGRLIGLLLEGTFIDVFIEFFFKPFIPFSRG